MKIEDFKKELENKEYDKIYEIIVDNSIKLAEKIAKMKNINIVYVNDSNTDEKLYTISYDFRHQSASFRSIIYYMLNLIEWNVDDKYIKKTKEEKLTEYICSYNSIKDSIKSYIDVQNQIKKYGYEKLKKDKMDKLVSLFKEMLDYKHKKYNSDFTFSDYIDKVSLYYNLFSDELYNALYAINSGFVIYDIEEDYIDVNEIEVLMILDSLYYSLTYEGDGYKENANFYRDFDLREGQTLEDLFKLEKEKFVNLFKTMLEFINVEYDKNGFESLKSEVIKYYPFYEISLNFMISSDPNTSLVSILDSMENVYERLSKDYKNYEKNIKEYNSSKNNDDSDNWCLD